MNIKKAFTLIELLVVIAIIALLLAILIPALQIAKEQASGAVCLNSVSGLSKAYYVYQEENESKLPSPVPGGAGSNNITNGTRYWVEVPQTRDGTATNYNSTVEEKWNGLRAGVLWPYAETEKVFHCVQDRRYLEDIAGGGKGPYRSYALPGGLNGWDNITLTSSVTGQDYIARGAKKFTDLVNPSGKFIFMEENYTHSPGTPANQQMNVGFNGGVWSFWRNRVYEAWWDPLAPWHNDRTNIGFADGHGEKRSWEDERTVWFSYDRVDPRLGSGTLECAIQENNPDQEYITRSYPARISRR